MATNIRAHNVVRAGTVVGGKLRVDNADDEGMFCCAEGESASDVSPKAGNSVRCLLVLRWDMEVFIPNVYWALCLWLFKLEALGFRRPHRASRQITTIRWFL